MSAANTSHEIIFSMQRVSKVRPPNKEILKDISLSFYYGAKIGVLGLNGAGKSTLLRIIAGQEKDFVGEVTADRNFSVGFLEQEPKLPAGKTVREAVEEGVSEIVSLLRQFEEISNKLGESISDDEMNKLLEKQAAIQDKLDATNAWELDSRLDQAMSALACPPADRIVDTLSGGERRRVALCRLLLSAPDVLLLDEPTNHLDAESVYWLEQHLAKYPGTVIAVTHDRYFLDNVAGWILELDRGRGIPWKGNYSSWLEQKKNRLEHEEKSEAKRVKTLARELEWIRQSPSARRAKSKARIANYEAMLNQSTLQKEEEIEIFIPSGPRLGKKVIEVDKISKGFGDKLLYRDLSFSLPQGGIVGVIGPNGAGKSTLFKILLGLEKPDSGGVSIGESVKLSYVDQNRFLPTDKRSIWECISDGQDIIRLGDREVNSRAYVARFNFSGSDQQKSIQETSGGERNRVHLAMALKDGGNVLLLDEPTNDLDVHTLRALEVALENFAGCAVVISHDRWFLDRIATHILAFEPDADGTHNVVYFDGNFSDYEADKHKRLGITNKEEEFGKTKHRKL